LASEKMDPGCRLAAFAGVTDRVVAGVVEPSVGLNQAVQVFSRPVSADEAPAPPDV
jgi:hypothetical protein